MGGVMGGVWSAALFVRARRELRRLPLKRLRAHMWLCVVLVGLAALAALFAVTHRPPSFGPERPVGVQVEVMRRVWHDVVRGDDGADGGTNRLWDSVSDDVAIVIKTGSEVAEGRLGILKRKGWLSLGRRVPNMLVVGERERKADGVVGIYRYGRELLAREEEGAGGGVGGNLPEKWFEKAGWKGDKDKNLPAFHLLRSLFPGKKWYVMIDDDTYFFLDNFAAFVKRHSAPEQMTWPLYTGKTFWVASCAQWGKNGEPLKSKGAVDRAGFAHGGSGIVLNGPAMDAMYSGVASCMRRFSSCWAGDMQVALCLRERGISPMRYNNSFERHFHPFSASKAMGDRRYTSRLQRDDAGPITFHKMTEVESGLLSDYERGQRKRNALVVYKGLLRWLLEHKVIPRYAKNPKLITHELELGHDDFIGLPQPVDTKNLALVRGGDLRNVKVQDIVPRF